MMQDKQMIAATVMFVLVVAALTAWGTTAVMSHNHIDRASDKPDRDRYLG